MEDLIAPDYSDDIDSEDDAGDFRCERLSSFTRLLIIVRDNVDVRLAFHQSRKSLHRTELDAKQS